MSPLTCFVEHGTWEEFSMTGSSLTPFGPCSQLGPHRSSTPKNLLPANRFPSLLPSRLSCLFPYSSFFHFLTYFKGWGSLAIAMPKVGILVLVSEFIYGRAQLSIILHWIFSNFRFFLNLLNLLGICIIFTTYRRICFCSVILCYYISETEYNRVSYVSQIQQLHYLALWWRAVIIATSWNQSPMQRRWPWKH
jgi:hypothetical protein